MTATLESLTNWVQDKTRFTDVQNFCDFCNEYLEYCDDDANLQATIISQNEHNYVFYQYGAEGNYQITRPLNTDLMLSAEDFETSKIQFINYLNNIQNLTVGSEACDLLDKVTYTCQQSIGATLDALPVGRSNAARKLHGDLFEQFMRILIRAIGIDVASGMEDIPIDIPNSAPATMKYQHDLILKEGQTVKAIGSVKTSSKDRIDKVFLDKYMYNRLTDKANLPHFAIFLNDIQRTGKAPEYRISSTFLPGHFKGYSIALNSMDGVYYCDLRPAMKTDTWLKEQIHPLSTLLVRDIWNFMARPRQACSRTE